MRCFSPGILAALALALAGCASVGSLQPPRSASRFTLESDYTRTRFGGLPTHKWVEGLAKGTYRLIGEDDRYRYYACDGDCVIALRDELAETYLRTGAVPPMAERVAAQGPIAGGHGGLMLPRSASGGGGDKPQLFYELHNTTDGAYAGIVGMTMVKLSEGSFNYIPFDDETALLGKIRLENR